MSIRLTSSALALAWSGAVLAGCSEPPTAPSSGAGNVGATQSPAALFVGGVAATRGGWSLVSAGFSHSCGITPGGDAFCWGSNEEGRLGDGTTTSSNVPVPVSGQHHFVSVSAGGVMSCGVTASGAAFCWGDDGVFELGDSGAAGGFSTVPVPVSGGHHFLSIVAGNSQACGVTVGGDAYCWGNNFSGGLGDGTTENRSVPVLVAGDHHFRSVSPSTFHTCGLTTGGDAYCWGANDFGALGDGTTTNSDVPVLVQGGHHFVQVAAGDLHSCGLTAGGAAYCWGLNSDGQLGDGTTQGSSAPVLVSGGHRFRSVVVAVSRHTCAVAVGGAALCWGANGDGQLGLGTTTPSSVPAPVLGDQHFLSISTGTSHSCGVAAGGSAFCWGRNADGQLGNGTTTTSSVPTGVLGPS